MPLPASPIFRDMIILRVSIGDCMLKELLAHLVFRRLSRDQAAAQIEKKSGTLRCALNVALRIGSRLACCSAFTAACCYLSCTLLLYETLPSKNLSLSCKCHVREAEPLCLSCLSGRPGSTQLRTLTLASASLHLHY
jgi:hypothetical protein